MSAFLKKQQVPSQWRRVLPGVIQAQEPTGVTGAAENAAEMGHTATGVENGHLGNIAQDDSVGIGGGPWGELGGEMPDKAEGNVWGLEGDDDD